MHLPEDRREISKNPFIVHAHPFHQSVLIEKVQISQQADSFSSGHKNEREFSYQLNV